jgi:hypothetical protein
MVQADLSGPTLSAPLCLCAFAVKKITPVKYKITLKWC